MPKGPRGEKRPADVVGAAVRVGRIAVGDVEDTVLAVPTSRAPLNWQSETRPTLTSSRVRVAPSKGATTMGCAGAFVVLVFLARSRPF